MNTTLHIPLNKQLKAKADKMAKSQGYSSLQEVIRVFLHSYAEGDVQTFLISEKSVEYMTTSMEKHLSRIEDELEEEIKQGTAYKASSIEEMMDILHNAKIDNEDE